MDMNTDMNLFQAVKEIIEPVLKNSPTCKDSLLHVHIKSSAKNLSSGSKGWFYVKVLTSLRVKKETFSDLPDTAALYEILRRMHELEDESHLCLQCPAPSPSNGPGSGPGSCPGAEGSVQYDLVLSGSSGLQVQHKVERQKPAQYTTLYLRMHENLMHVMKQCGEIHSYLRRLKVFRPQWDIAFNMKLGDVHSKNDFWVDNWKRVSERLPCIVTQTDFYLRLSRHAVTEICSSAHFSLPSHLDVPLLSTDKTLPSSNISMQLSAACLVFPAPKSVEYTRVLVMTLYGPGLIPQDVRESSLSHVLEAVCWSELGFKLKPTEDAMKKDVVFPCHAMVAMETYKHELMENSVVLVFLVLEHVTSSHQDTHLCRYDIDSTLLQNQLKFVHCIKGVLGKAFTPIQEKLKTRKLTMRSITSVCKAITDIVTMSDSEAFRKAVLNSMQVADTVDLGASLERKLTNISKQKHHAVWVGASSDVPRMNQYTQEMRDNVTDQTKDNTKRRRLSLPTETVSAIVTPPESPAIENHTTALSEVSPFHKFADSDADSSVEEVGVDPGPVGDCGDRTPEIAQITASLQQASPFQELGEVELGEHQDCTDTSRTSAALYGPSLSDAHGTCASLSEDPYRLVHSNPLGGGAPYILGSQLNQSTSRTDAAVYGTSVSGAHGTCASLSEDPYRLMHSNLLDSTDGFRELGQKELEKHHSSVTASSCTTSNTSLYGPSVSGAHVTCAPLTEGPYRLMHSNILDGGGASSLGFQKALSTSEDAYTLVHSNLWDVRTNSSQQTWSTSEHTSKTHGNDINLLSSRQNLLSSRQSLPSSRQDLCTEQLTYNPVDTGELCPEKESTSTKQKEEYRREACLDGSEGLDNEDRLDVEDWSATFNVVSDFIDSTASDIIRSGPNDKGNRQADIVRGIPNEKGDAQSDVVRDILNETRDGQASISRNDPNNAGDNESKNVASLTVANKDSTMKSCDNLPDSDDWFNNVLDEVEDWLN